MGKSRSLSLRSSSRKAKENSTCLSGYASTSPPSPRQPTGRRSLRFLKGAKVECCEITDPYMNTDRNKNCISIVIKRADFETKTPDYPGSWIIEEDYAAQPAGGPLL